jgi:type II secretory pathway component PulF
MLGDMVLVSLAWQRTMRDPIQRTRWDAARLRWPVIGSLERTREAAAYTGTLSVALKSGVGLLSAMALARAVVANRQIGNELASAEARVRDGGTLAGALDGVLPPLAVRLLDAGEIGGDLAMLAGRAADSADDEVQQAVSRAVTLVEPVMILGFGGLVGFVALALLQAIYGINARSL